jgi:methylated-DNA-[protein]-cysteine S-methyltransferase
MEQPGETTMSLASLAGACTAQTTIVTPLGALLLARTASGLAGAWFANQKAHPMDIAAPRRDDDALLRDAASQFAEYFAGRRSDFDLPLDLRGTDFQRRVWQALLRIAIGRTSSYGEIARELGAPKAVRAVGGAVGRNPVSVIVPCHRVIGSDGSLTGYAGGLQRKRALLQLEGAL